MPMANPYQTNNAGPRSAGSEDDICMTPERQGERDPSNDSQRGTRNRASESTPVKYAR